MAALEIQETVSLTHRGDKTVVKVTLRYGAQTVNWSLTTYVGHVSQSVVDCRRIARKRLDELATAMKVEVAA